MVNSGQLFTLIAVINKNIKLKFEIFFTFFLIYLLELESYIPGVDFEFCALIIR